MLLATSVCIIHCLANILCTDTVLMDKSEATVPCHTRRASDTHFPLPLLCSSVT